MTVLEKIDSLLRENNLNKRQLSIKADMPYSTIDNIWKRGSDSMRLPTFMKICDFFGVTMDSMACDDKEIEYKSDNKKPLSKVERDLLANFSVLDERGQNSVLDTAHREAGYIKEASSGELNNAG